MFYQFDNNSLRRFSAPPAPGKLTIGYITAAELEEYGPGFGFSPENIRDCQKENAHFRSGVEVYEEYTCTELSLLSLPEAENSRDEIALFIRKDLLLLVSIVDADGSTEKKFQEALARFSPERMTRERFLSAFLDRLVSRDVTFLERVRDAVSRMEKAILEDEPPKDLSLTLLELKNRLLRVQNYYNQLLDFTEAAEENLNELFDEKGLLYLSNSGRRIERLLEDVKGLSASADHLEDAISAQLDLRMNRSMKVLTVLTSILFPLTIISGWYGMNFQSQPEFGWKYGYLYVICLAAGSISLFFLLGRKKKWF